MNHKTIFITGAASGIGKATAKLFAANGWYVGLYDVNKKGLLSLRKEIGDGRCCIKVADVTDVKSMIAAMKHFESNTGGRLNVLFACAGVLSMGYHDEIFINNQHFMVDVNLKGILNTIHAGFDLLKRTPDSKIIMMSSAASLAGVAHLAVYSATKAAVSSLAESLNMEFERHGIHVCDVRIPYANTPMLQQEVLAASVTKLGISMDPEDVAKIVLRTTEKNKIHNDGGLLSFHMLKKMPAFIRLPILKLLFLPSRGKK